MHPNLQARNAAKRLRALWAAFDREALCAVISAEHVFKDASGAYRRLVAARPAGANTHVYPGAELVSREDIDVLCFAEHDWYDDHPELLVPYALPLRHLIARLEAVGLPYFIPHPYIANNKLKRLFPDPAELKAFLGTVQGFEVANGALLQLWQLLRLRGLRRPARRVRDRLCATAAPELRCFPVPRKFIAAGSDAHHPAEIGSVYVELACREDDRSAVFQAMTANTDPSRIHMAADRFSPRAFAWTTFTAFAEAGQKRRHLLTQRRLERGGAGAFVPRELAKVRISES